MILGLLLAVVLWAHPAPQLWICDPGHGPLTPSNCERVHYELLGKFPAP